MNPLMVVGLFINATALAHAVVLWLALCVIAVHVIRTQGDGLSKWGLRGARAYRLGGDPPNVGCSLAQSFLCPAAA